MKMTLKEMGVISDKYQAASKRAKTLGEEIYHDRANDVSINLKEFLSHFDNKDVFLRFLGRRSQVVLENFLEGRLESVLIQLKPIKDVYGSLPDEESREEAIIQVEKELNEQ